MLCYVGLMLEGRIFCFESIFCTDSDCSVLQQLVVTPVGFTGHIPRRVFVCVGRSRVRVSRPGFEALKINVHQPWHQPVSARLCRLIGCETDDLGYDGVASSVLEYVQEVQCPPSFRRFWQGKLKHVDLVDSLHSLPTIIPTRQHLRR